MISSQMPVWYLQDEVGSAIAHSDQPNLKVVPFCFSPTNVASDTVTFNIVWPIADIKSGAGLYRDFLPGVSEAQYRSARLHTWFCTPDDYYTKSLKQYRNMEIKYDVEGEFTRIQDEHALRGSLPNDKLKVFTDDEQISGQVKDARFEFVNEAADAEICWPLGLNRAEVIKQAKEASKIVNEFPDDSVLLIPDLLASLMHSTYPHDKLKML